MKQEIDEMNNGGDKRRIYAYDGCTKKTVGLGRCAGIKIENAKEVIMLVKEYSDLEISTPDCMPGITIWTASFYLDADISSLFPYINADIKKSAYYEQHPCILFELNGVKWSLYPNRASGLPFLDKEQAMGFIQNLFDYLNDLDDRNGTIEPNFEAYKPIPVLDVFKCLPGSNCKKCDYATCMAFAAALSKGEAVLDQCLELEGFDEVKVIKLKAMLP